MENQQKNKMQKLTAIIPTGNEIHNIEAVIASVNFADEILIADSFSTDGTYDKALQLAHKVIRRPFKYHADHKNWAISQAKHSWVLLVDADERITDELKKEIQEILKNPPHHIVAYWISRANYFMGKKINYSGWRGDKVIRLFKKEFCKYQDILVHEEIIAQGKVSKLKNKLNHNTYVNLKQYIEKLNKYSDKQAIEFNVKTKTLTPYHFIIKPFWAFFKHYILQSGFRDGIAGIVIGYFQAYRVFMRYLKIWLIRRDIK